MQPYKRLDYASYLEPLAPALTSCIPKIYPPEHFRGRFTDQTSVHIVPLKGEIIEACSYLLEQPVHVDTDMVHPIMRSAGFKALKTGSVEHVLTLLAAKLDITIYLVDAYETLAIFADLQLDAKNPAIALFKNDIGQVFPIIINEMRILQQETATPILPADKKNMLLRQKTGQKIPGTQKLSLQALQAEALKRGFSAMREGPGGLLVMKTREDLIGELGTS